MKRLAAVVFALLMIPAVSVKASCPPELSAFSAILMDAESGRVLFEQNAHQQLPIASITKLMTALVAAENIADLSESVTVRAEWTGVEGSSIYLRAGEVLTLETLMYGLLLNSGNDAAVAIASYCSGNVSDFVAQMNFRAKQLGMVHSHFKNPNGLNEEGHYSTAYDMALLARACIENLTVSRIAATKTIKLGTRTFTNHNKLLWRYDGCIGMKTGYTEAAGRTLVSAACRDGQTLIAVTLNAADDWNDHIAMFDFGFNEYSNAFLCSEHCAVGQVAISGSLVRVVPVETSCSVSYPLNIRESVRTKIMLTPCLSAPVKNGDRIGSIQFFLENKLIGETDLVVVSDVCCDVIQSVTLKDRLKKLIEKIK